ncbi:MAG: hypothetical protein ACYTHM_19765 [Planctomycetota bacterium]
MKILLESRSLQGQAHREREGAKGKRLNVFLEILQSAATRTTVQWTPGALEQKQLEDVDVLIIPTRMGPIDAAEIRILETFVRDGGGLFLLSNHHPLHECDALIARAFGIRLEGTFFRTPGSPTRIARDDFLEMDRLQGEGERERFHGLVTNTTCSLWCDDGAPLARLPETMREKTTDEPPDGALFALAFDGRSGAWPGRKGRLLVLADSGLLGDRESRIPGPGLIEEGDNRTFLRNAVQWLAGAL